MQLGAEPVTDGRSPAELVAGSEGLGFTLYGRAGDDSGTCTSSALGIIEGTASSRELPETVTGRLSLQLGEISGAGCTEEERAQAGEGATFTYRARRIAGHLLRRGATCDSKVWAIGPEACGVPIWDGSNAAARCCCE
jgi:hypothetical protein